MFAVPSSDPPSTPGSRREDDDDEHPSTTPAGPPSAMNYTNLSFTPAGPPPPSFYGSSLFGESATDFNHKTNTNTKARPFSKPSFAVPSSPPAEYESDDDMDADGESLLDEFTNHNQFTSGFRSVNQQPPPPPRAPQQQQQQHQQPAMAPSPRGLKRSRYGDVMGNSLRQSTGLRMEKDRQSAIPAIAKSLANKAAPPLAETDDMVLRTDKIMSQLDADVKLGHAGQSPVIFTRTAQQLSQLWMKHTSSNSQSGGIGPRSQSNVDKANYLAQLLLRLHQPFHPTPNFQSSYSRPQLVLASDVAAPIPRALLDWLNKYHNPFPDDMTEVVTHKPSPVGHERFWDIIYACTLRGTVTNAIHLLETADWTKADSAIEDGYDTPGYTGRHLEAVREVVARCIDLLRACPAVTDNDWDFKGPDWSIFRNRTRRELQELEAFAEADSQDKAPSFQASAFGSFSTASRRAESKVPWAIYESLRTLYGQILGKKDEIMVATQDWLEAVMFLTVWWDGEDDVPFDNLAASRYSMRQSQAIRQVDVSPLFAYKRQLLLAFASVTDKPEEDEFYLNTVNPMHVGLACICEDDLQGAIGLLRSWSLPIATAVVELARAGGWLPSPSTDILDAFDQDDLMVLSHGQPEQPDSIKPDDILIQYASVLSKKDAFTDLSGNLVQEGWDLACHVLGRLSSFDTTKSKISELLSDLPLDSTTRVDKILTVCGEIGLPDQVREIAERYADDLAASSQSYGSALLYYARAHATKKLRSTVDLLISMCLVQSAAFPPSATLDPQLDALLNDQHATLGQLARADMTAAQLLAAQLSGYATLRRFYDLRDANPERAAAEAEVEEDDFAAATKAGNLRPWARKREAARALMAVIESSADSIRGGLYDDMSESVVQVDALMALLCEALPLMNQQKQILKTPHLLTIIRATEDLETVTPAVYAQTSSLFTAAIQNFTSTAPDTLSSSQDLAKSVGALGKSMVGSKSLLGGDFAMVDSVGSLKSMDGGSGASEGGLKVKRGWDWRAGAVYMRGKNVGADEVMRVLRSRVAIEMAKVWV